MRASASSNAIHEPSKVQRIMIEMLNAQERLDVLMLEREEMKAAAEKRKNSGSGRCYKCNKPGHRAKVCPLKGNAQPLHLQSWMRL